MNAGRSLLFAVPAVALLAAAVWWITANPPSTEPARFDQSARSLAATLNNPADAGASEIAPEKLDQVYARPLFSANRRPWEPKRVAPPKKKAVQQVAKVEISIPEADLAGVSITPESSKVLLVNRNTGAATWVEQGQEYESWTVAAISAADVTLRQGDSEAVLKLYPHSK